MRKTDPRRITGAGFYYPADNEIFSCERIMPRNNEKFRKCLEEENNTEYKSCFGSSNKILQSKCK